MGVCCRLPVAGVSKHYYTVLDVSPVGEILVIGLHFKAIPKDRGRCATREAQTAILCDIVRREALERCVLLLVRVSYSCADFLEGLRVYMCRRLLCVTVRWVRVCVFVQKASS